MKTFKLLTVTAFCLMATVLLSSCGIMKNNDFSSQKYTHFKKGETATITNTSNKEKKEVAAKDVVSGKEEISEISNVATNEPVQPIINSVQKNETVSTAAIDIAIPKEITNVKLNRMSSFVMNRIAKKANTESVSGSDTNLILLVILAILLPPLSAFLARGLGTEFWIDLLLTILFWIPGVIYALLLAFDVV